MAKRDLLLEVSENYIACIQYQKEWTQNRLRTYEWMNYVGIAWFIGGLVVFFFLPSEYRSIWHAIPYFLIFIALILPNLMRKGQYRSDIEECTDILDELKSKLRDEGIDYDDE